MAYNFGTQKYPAFGSYGEFSVGGGKKIRAQYLLTKIRPGSQGSWENQLASQMAPWREIFNIEELSFDELIQRDLDDSRVAHDLIPYLLGETGQNARFFPPILAVLVPKRQDRSGIAQQYPPAKINEGDISFGDLFDFQIVKFDKQETPLAQISYNTQRTALVIVDGQHRAMAVLALHRQLNKSWGSDPFAPYYEHIQVTNEAVAHVELPVCVLFFPDLTEDDTVFKDAGIDLVSVCREVFTVVNKAAKQVSKSRELLLDDEDFAAFMMRRTLTRFKDRPATEGSARIYSFAFGDSEADSGSAVLAGQLEICSAVALHKLHAATSFSLPAAFHLTKTADVTDGRNVRNPARPVELLQGSDGPHFQALSRRTAKTHSPNDVQVVVDLLGEITDSIILPAFDRLRPFVAHNLAMQELLTALDSSTSRADPVQSRVRALLFDGSGNRHVFEEHVARLKEREAELKEFTKPIPTHLQNQLQYCDSVSRALLQHEEQLRLRRSQILFNIDPVAFSNRDAATVDDELKKLKARGKSIVDAVTTQAFQIGYLMAVLSQVEIMLPADATYAKRAAVTTFVSELFLTALNEFFSVAQTKHRSLSGYVSEPRARAFEATAQGFRGLLASTGVSELNEKQWVFFRYMVFEIVHSKFGIESVRNFLNKAENTESVALYREHLQQVTNDIESLREKYFESAFSTAAKAPDFRRETDLLEAKARAEGKSDDEVKKLTTEAVEAKRQSVLQVSKAHLKASLGRVDTKAAILKRFDAATKGQSDPAAVEELESLSESESAEEQSNDRLEVAIIANDLTSGAPEEEVIVQPVEIQE